jgi:hypothetical protein
MYRKQVAFQLERTVPGTFLMQGLLGGLLGGFVATLVAMIAWKPSDFSSVFDLTATAIVFSGISGVIKAEFMWGAYRLFDIQLRALARVAVAWVVSALFVGVLSYIEFEGKFLSGCSIWLTVVGTSVALLVGSRVKPWQLFTFGSVAAGDVDQRAGSRSILATLGTLPLRFLNISAIAFMALYVAYEVNKLHNANEALAMSLFMSVIGSYPLFGAYVTFRSPRKIVLFVLGVIINIPITLVWLLGLRWYLAESDDEVPFRIVAISGAFILAWGFFLIARLGAKLRPAPSLSISSNKSIAAAPNLGHECLGSRFSEWQQHAA